MHSCIPKGSFTTGVRQIVKRRILRRECIYAFRLGNIFIEVCWMDNCRKKWNPLPTNESRLFTDVSEGLNPFPTQSTTFFWFNNPQWFATRAECINAFPTNTYHQIPICHSYLLHYLINLNKKSGAPMIVKPFSSRHSSIGWLTTTIFCIWSLSFIYGFISRSLVSIVERFSQTWM